jgi:hypothetical protein
MQSSRTLEDKDLLPSQDSSLQVSRKIIYGLMVLLLIYVVVRSMFAAAGKPFWFDELCTLTVATQGTWKGILGALRALVDSHPPLFYKIEHWAWGLSPNKEIALRLPSILAFPCVLVCVFVYVKKLSGETVALLCAAFLLMTSLFQYYATEARGYSMVAACIAFALVCYQRVPAPLWTALLAMSLALAESLHFMAIIPMAAFGVAETVFSCKAREIRWSVWAALAAGALPLALLWSSLAKLGAYYGPGLYDRFFQFSAIPHIYGEILESGTEFGFGFAGLLFSGILLALLQRGTQVNKAGEKAKQLAEAACLLAFIALPFVGYFLLVRVAHSGFEGRYTVYSALGMALSSGYILSRAKSRDLAVLATFVLCVVSVHELHFWRSVRKNIKDVNSVGAAAEQFIASAGYNELSVVVPELLSYVQITHYSGSQTASDRLLCLTRIPIDKNGHWNDTADKSIDVLKLYIPLRTSDFSEFAAAHREFLVYVEEKDPGRDRLTPYLSKDGWTLQTVALDDWRRVYLVSKGGLGSAEQSGGQKPGSVNAN